MWLTNYTANTHVSGLSLGRWHFLKLDDSSAMASSPLPLTVVLKLTCIGLCWHSQWVSHAAGRGRSKRLVTAPQDSRGFRISHGSMNCSTEPHHCCLTNNYTWWTSIFLYKNSIPSQPVPSDLTSPKIRLLNKVQKMAKLVCPHSLNSASLMVCILIRYLIAWSHTFFWFS